MADPTLIGAGLRVGGAILGGILGRKSAKKDLWEQRAYERDALIRLRDDAQRAGFNPLTALRAGALNHGASRILPPPGGAFAAQYIGDAIGEVFDKKANEPIEKYNAEIRKLELEQRKADLSIAKATLGQIGAKEQDVYAPYGEYIPVRVGNNLQQLDKTVATRLGIKPNDRLTPGDIEELLGEFRGTLSGAIESEIADQALRPPPLLGTPTITKTTLPDVNPPALSKSWFEKMIDNAETNWSMGNPNLSGLIK